MSGMSAFTTYRIRRYGNTQKSTSSSLFRRMRIFLKSPWSLGFPPKLIWLRIRIGQPSKSRNCCARAIRASSSSSNRRREDFSYYSRSRRANSPQKLTRPGFGPAAEPPRSAQPARRHAACIARLTCRQAACRVGFGTWALAVQLRVCSVRPTKDSFGFTFPPPALCVVRVRLVGEASPPCVSSSATYAGVNDR